MCLDPINENLSKKIDHPVSGQKQSIFVLPASILALKFIYG
jgi:hypothetical protein